MHTELCLHYSRVTGGAFAGVVPPRQLLVEEAAEDVGALSHSSGCIVEEVSVFKEHMNTIVSKMRFHLHESHEEPESCQFKIVLLT